MQPQPITRKGNNIQNNDNIPIQNPVPTVPVIDLDTARQMAVEAAEKATQQTLEQIKQMQHREEQEDDLGINFDKKTQTKLINTFFSNQIKQWMNPPPNPIQAAIDSKMGEVTGTVVDKIFASGGTGQKKSFYFELLDTAFAHGLGESIGTKLPETIQALGQTIGQKKAQELIDNMQQKYMNTGDGPSNNPNQGQSEVKSEIEKQKDMVLTLDPNNPQHITQYASAMGLSVKAARNVLMIHQDDIIKERQLSKSQTEQTPDNFPITNQRPNNTQTMDQQMMDQRPNNVQMMNQRPNNVQMMNQRPNNVQMMDQRPNNVQMMDQRPNNVQMMDQRSSNDNPNFDHNNTDIYTDRGTITNNTVVNNPDKDMVKDIASAIDLLINKMTGMETQIHKLQNKIVELEGEDVINKEKPISIDTNIVDRWKDEEDIVPFSTTPQIVVPTISEPKIEIEEPLQEPIQNIQNENKNETVETTIKEEPINEQLSQIEVTQTEEPIQNIQNETKNETIETTVKEESANEQSSQIEVTQTEEPIQNIQNETKNETIETTVKEEPTFNNRIGYRYIKEETTDKTVDNIKTSTKTEEEKKYRKWKGEKLEKRIIKGKSYRVITDGRDIKEILDNENNLIPFDQFFKEE